MRTFTCKAVKIIDVIILGIILPINRKKCGETHSQYNLMDRRAQACATGENAFWLHFVWRLTLVASKTLIMLHFGVCTARTRSNHKEAQTIFVYEIFWKNFPLLLLLLHLFFLIVIFTILWIWLKLCIRKQQQIYSANVPYACSNFVQVQMQTFAKPKNFRFLSK